MDTSGGEPAGAAEPKTTREIIDAMQTPQSVEGVFALFLALEFEAITYRV